jgi:hypothetical protein
MASPIPPMLVELQLETAKIRSQMEQLQNNFKDFGKTVEKQTSFLSNFKSMAAGVFAGNLLTNGLNAVKNAFTGAVQEAQAYESVSNKIKAVLESTGNVASLSVKGLQEQASALEGIAAVDEQVILQGQLVLATFTQVRNVVGEGNDIFNQTTKAALDMAAVLKTDVSGSAMMLGKALNDPIAGMTRLTRSGVQFTDEQKAMVKQLVESGNVLGAQKIILAEVNREFGGAAAAAGDTFAGAVFRAKDKVDDFTKNLVTNLQPILLSIGKTLGDLYNKYLIPVFNWLGKNKEAIIAFATAIAVGYTALKIYNAVLVVSKGVQTAWTVATTIMRGASLATIASTNGLAASMLAFNAAARANPIGIIVTALALLAAGFVYAWNNSDTFRKFMIAAGKAGITAISFIIEQVGKLAVGLIKLATGPLRLLLKGLEAIGVGSAGDALKTIESGLDKVGTFFDNASKKVKEYSKNLDSLANKKIKLPSFGGGTTPDASGATGVASDPTSTAGKAEREKERLKKLSEAQKDAAIQYKKLADQENQKAKLIADYEKDVARKRLEYDEKVADIKKNNAKSVAKAQATYAEQGLKIEKDYQNKIVTATKEAAEKRASIVQTSIDRLRDIFKTATSLDVGKIFSDLLGGDQPLDATVGNIINKLKDKLANSKNLLTQTQGLKDKGFSQTFIEQIVGQGTEIGTQLAQKINEATPETIKELQTLFLETEANANTGIDALATSMNTGMKLATQELIKAYAEVGTELNTKLAEYAVEFQEAMATAKKDLNEALTELATELAESLADAKKDLDRVLADMQDSFTQALSAINSEIQETITAITTLMTLMASLGGSATYGKLGAGGGRTDSATSRDLTADYARFKAKEAADEKAANINITNNLSSNLSASEITQATLNAIRFGQTVTTGRDR